IDYPDHLGDLSWCTLVSERTARGKELLESAERDGAVKLYELPKRRYSKRTMNFSLEKKLEGYVRLRRRLRKGQPVPDYHHAIPKTSLRAWIVETIYRSTRILRGPRARRIGLRILFSSFGKALDVVNTFRKRLFLRLHGN
ncbi:MAG: hypothetical protein KAJ01_08740, partial [Candidatus Hydrogenedentes bacterium]|nr:hypothetical protein [Candidatus Hydrogenedentota bacterium]